MGIEGYFAWVKTTKGIPAPQKYHIWRETNIMPETKKYYEDITIAKWPLNEDEWEWTLDQLAAKYPVPK